MNCGTDGGDRIAHHLLYSEYAQKGIRLKLFFNLLYDSIGSEISFYERMPECGRYFLGYMVEFHLQFFRNETALQINYSQVKHGAACAELAQVNEVPPATLVKYHVAYVQVTMYGSIGIR